MTTHQRSPGAPLARPRGLAVGLVLLAAVVAAGCAGPAGPDPGPLVDRLFMFQADDGVHGLEPWVSDGTSEGTRMLADLMPGASGAADLVNVWFRVGDELVFSARTPDGSTFALYRTDGTSEGTVLGVEGLRFDAGDAYAVGEAIVLSNTVTSGPRGPGIYRTDGTAAGTVRLGDVDPGFGTRGVRVPPVAANRGHRETAGVVYVRGSRDLWRLDGDGAERLSAFGETCGAFFELGVLDGVLYFPASGAFEDPVTGAPQDARCELWRYDPDGAGEPTLHRSFTMSTDQYATVRGYAVRQGWLYYSLIVWEQDAGGGSVVTYQLRATNGGPVPSDPLADDLDDRVVQGADAANHPGFGFVQRAVDEPIYLLGRNDTSDDLLALMLLEGDPDDASLTLVQTGDARGFEWVGTVLVYWLDGQVYGLANGSTEPFVLVGAPSTVGGPQGLLPDWYDDRLFVWADEPGADGLVSALYVTDGTPAGTTRVATFCHRSYAGCASD